MSLCTPQYAIANERQELFYDEHWDQSTLDQLKDSYLTHIYDAGNGRVVTAGSFYAHLSQEFCPMTYAAALRHHGQFWARAGQLTAFPLVEMLFVDHAMCPLNCLSIIVYGPFGERKRKHQCSMINFIDWYQAGKDKNRFRCEIKDLYRFLWLPPVSVYTSFVFNKKITRESNSKPRVQLFFIIDSRWLLFLMIGSLSRSQKKRKKGRSREFWKRIYFNEIYKSIVVITTAIAMHSELFSSFPFCSHLFVCLFVFFSGGKKVTTQHCTNIQKKTIGMFTWRIESEETSSGSIVVSERIVFLSVATTDRIIIYIIWFVLSHGKLTGNEVTQWWRRPSFHFVKRWSKQLVFFSVGKGRVVSKFPKPQGWVETFRSSYYYYHSNRIMLLLLVLLIGVLIENRQQ